ncbi:MAG TPA: D-alanyl-D-alanine carboxypeptidase [Terriglobia bacterium]|nr:D-alanyl-D-alanine carboxypeptidase [Terriglobia bacterium]
MTKYLLSTTCLMLLLFWPIQAQESITNADNHNGTVQPVVPARFSTVSETIYLKNLSHRGYKLDTQGLLIESLDASTVYADLNSDVGFNPASVIKIATSFAALTRFGPEYHFETSFMADGPVNKKTRTLNGNLVLFATGDPALTTADVLRLGRQVVKAGIVQVNGNLIVSGPFTYGFLYTTDQAMKGLTATLRKLGVRVKGTTKTGEARGEKLASHISSSLRDILFSQNAHSSNPTAERVGEAIGGPKAVEQFLVNEVGIPRGEVSISHTSGLDYNRITPRATVKLFRELVFWLNLYGLQPQDIMPVAGIDPGTLRGRFTDAEYRGAIVGKTGTLPGTDGGVSTLAGVLYTRDRGVLLFAIFNSRGSVRTYRRLQDGFLKDVLTECGGIPQLSESLHKLNN